MLKFFSYFKNPLQKLPVNKSHARRMTTAINHNQENYEAQATTLLTFYDALLSYKTPEGLKTTYMQALKDSMIKKTIHYMQNDPHYGFMLHKKVKLAVLKKVAGRKCLSIDKEEALVQIKKAFPNMQSNKYHLLVNEQVSYPALYEIYAAGLFGSQQHSVHQVIIRDENSIHSKQIQDESFRLTKQPNCDLNVEYKAGEGVVTKTMLDILIGRNKEYKGNLVVTTCKDNLAMKQQYDHFQFLLNNFPVKNNITQDQEREIKQVSAEMKIIWDSDITKVAKIVYIQEKMMHFMPTARKINPNFNPNMIAFFPEKEPIQDIGRQTAVKSMAAILAKQAEPLGANSPDNLVHQVIKETLPIYLAYRQPDLSVMSPSDRKFTQDFLNNYFPEYLKTLPNYTAIVLGN